MYAQCQKGCRWLRIWPFSASVKINLTGIGPLEEVYANIPVANTIGYFVNGAVGLTSEWFFSNVWAIAVNIKTFYITLRFFNVTWVKNPRSTNEIASHDKLRINVWKPWQCVTCDNVWWRLTFSCFFACWKSRKVVVIKTKVVHTFSKVSSTLRLRGCRSNKTPVRQCWF